MKKGLSYKDLLLLVGILVAIIVALTTWVYTEHPAESSRFFSPAPKKTNVMAAPAAAAKKLSKKILVILDN